MSRSRNKAKGRIKQPITPKNNIQSKTTPITSDHPLTFDFTRKEWLQSIKQKRFTNKLRGSEMFAQNMYHIMYKLIPTLQQNWEDIEKKSGHRSGWPNCHEISVGKTDLVHGIIEQIHGEGFIKGIEEKGSSLWQFGVTQGIRLIAIRNYHSNVITPLFIDHHHLVHPNEKHNETDYSSYKFCPVCEYRG